ncbi:TIGR03905 family TSCPD domain-containing protein [Fusobacterium sp.]|uniref:TIGR03905 family TSCPD domain-containing protein n=1 Tax=Fusobacterium sp. TaxID=68766 RepID=UPI00396CC599
MQYYKTKGVCAREIGVEVESDGTIKNVEFCGGCDGNTHGLSNLIAGMKKDDVIKKLEGIQCGSKGTSCPDQLAQILKSL